MDKDSIEDGIIGSIIVDPSCLYEIYDKVKPEMFESIFCRSAYETALSLYDRKVKFDETVLANEMTNKQINNAEAIKKQLEDIVMATPVSVNVQDYVNILISKYQAREVRQLFKDADTSYTGIKNTIGDVITRLEELQNNKKRHSRKAVEISDKFRDTHFDGNKFDESKVVKTGLNELDNIISLEPGDVTIIGARPSVGKSALALQIAKNVSERGLKVGYFNLEMMDGQIYERLIASMSSIPLERIRKAKNFLGDEKENYFKADEEFRKLNLIVSTGGKTDLDIRLESRHQKFDLIIIDYLQLIQFHGRSENRRTEVGAVSRSLKNLATELDIPIIILSQLTRKTEFTADKEPTMADLRETGDIEQDASIIILMWNLSDDIRKYKGLKVDKNRQGNLVSVPLYFNGDNMSFSVIDSDIEKIKEQIKDMKPVNNSETPFC